MVDSRILVMKSMIRQMKLVAPANNQEVIDDINKCVEFINRVTADGKIGENEVPLLLTILQSFMNIYQCMPDADKTAISELNAIISELQTTKNYPNTMDESLHGLWASGILDPGKVRELSNTVKTGLTSISNKIQQVAGDTVMKISNPATTVTLIDDTLDVASELWDAWAFDPISGRIAKVVVEESILALMKCAKEIQNFDAGRHIPLMYRGA